MRLSISLASLVLVVVSLGAMGGTPRPAEAVTTAIISVDMDPGAPGVQASAVRVRSAAPVVVDVVIENASDVGAFDIVVSFDAQSLAFDAWDEGAFLGSSGRQTACLPIIAERSFRLGCGTAGPSPPPAASGAGVLVSLTFTDVRTSTTCISLTLAEVATINGDPLPATHQGGCLTVLADQDADGVANIADNCPQIANASQLNTDAANAAANRPGADALGDACDSDIDGDGYANDAETALREDPLSYCGIMRADVNKTLDPGVRGDGVINSLDLSAVAKQWGPHGTETRENQNGDPAINSLDLMVLAQRFGMRTSACS